MTCYSHHRLLGLVGGVFLFSLYSLNYQEGVPFFLYVILGGVFESILDFTILFLSRQLDDMTESKFPYEFSTKNMMNFHVCH